MNVGPNDGGSIKLLVSPDGAGDIGINATIESGTPGMRVMLKIG